jgi:D-2-hydroxyacid dehydrogenase (NADP+)
MTRTRTTLFSLLLFLPTTATVLAEDWDAETKAIIERLGLKEAPEPVSKSPLWKRPDKIFIAITASDPDQQQEMLRSVQQVADGIELVPLMWRFGQRPDPQLLAEAEVLLGFCSPDIIAAAPKLRWLQHYGTGVDHCVMDPAVRERNFILTNMQRTAGPPIAEHVIAMMMSLARNLPGFYAAQLEGRWELAGFANAPIIEVGGKTMLVVGLGGIGTEIARRAAGLSMRVIATRRSSREGYDFVDYVGLPNELHDLAKQADVVVNALPLTDETKGIFDKRFFDVVKRGAYFISIGRGKSTITADLIAALEDGRIGGAGLDVTDPEPLPPDHPLWKLPNVIITPHLSWVTDRGFERGWLVIRENLRRYINGEPLLNVVDIERGY